MGEEWFQNSGLGNSTKQNSYLHTQCVLWQHTVMCPARYLVLNVYLQKAEEENHPYDCRIASVINTISSEDHSRTDSRRKYSKDRKSKLLFVGFCFLGFDSFIHQYVVLWPYSPPLLSLIHLPFLLNLLLFSTSSCNNH